MHHKQIMIDGIMGSGKTSTAQYFTRQLDLNGFDAIWHHEEGENHPV